MPYSGGTFSIVNTFISGTTILASKVNENFSDIATNGLSFAMLKNGTQTITANLPMASHKLTGLSAGTANGDSLRYEQLGSRTASFSANKNGSDQSIGSTAATKVTFGTEVFDVGSHFASSTWTPPAGTVLVSASVYGTSVIADEEISVMIYKNGAAKLIKVVAATSIGSADASVTLLDTANGTDTYEVYIQSATDTAYSVFGDVIATRFMGTMV